MSVGFCFFFCLVIAFSVFPAGVREAEGLHADPRVQHGEGQSGWSPHMLLCAHQQEGQHLSAPHQGVSLRNQEEPESDH